MVVEQSFVNTISLSKETNITVLLFSNLGLGITTILFLEELFSI